jgi:hypothetical protein
MAKQIRLITDSHKRRLKQIERHANEASASENEDGANGRWRNNLAYFKVTGKLGSGSYRFLRILFTYQRFSGSVMFSKRRIRPELESPRDNVPSSWLV